MNPDDLDAKHNLELALRQLPPQAQDSQDEPPPPQDESPPPQSRASTSSGRAAATG